MCLCLLRWVCGRRTVRLYSPARSASSGLARLFCCSVCLSLPLGLLIICFLVSTLKLWLHHAFVLQPLALILPNSHGSVAVHCVRLPLVILITNLYIVTIENALENLALCAVSVRWAAILLISQLHRPPVFGEHCFCWTRTSRAAEELHVKSCFTHVHAGLGLWMSSQLDYAFAVLCFMRTCALLRAQRDGCSPSSAGPRSEA